MALYNVDVPPASDVVGGDATVTGVTGTFNAWLDSSDSTYATLTAGGNKQLILPNVGSLTNKFITNMQVVVRAASVTGSGTNSFRLIWRKGSGGDIYASAPVTVTDLIANYTFNALPASTGGDWNYADFSSNSYSFGVEGVDIAGGEDINFYKLTPTVTQTDAVSSSFTGPLVGGTGHTVYPSADAPGNSCTITGQPTCWQVWKNPDDSLVLSQYVTFAPGQVAYVNFNRANFPQFDIGEFNLCVSASSGTGAGKFTPVWKIGNNVLFGDETTPPIDGAYTDANHFTYWRIPRPGKGRWKWEDLKTAQFGLYNSAASDSIFVARLFGLVRGTDPQYTWHL